MITQISQTAKTYADALIETNQSNDDILKDLETVSKIIDSSNDLKTVLNTPAVPVEQKIEIINDIFKSQVSQNILNFLKILAEKKRFNEFEEILQAFKNKFDEIQGIKRVTVISAIELSDEYKTRITDKLKEKLQKNIYADWQVDSEIIGGLIIRIDDNVIDTSIQNKLENLSKNIIKGNL